MTHQTTVAVRYIGPRSTWKDRIYGTGLYFTTGQTRHVPPLVARRLLRHGDLFEAGEAEEGEGNEVAETAPADDTEALLEQGKQAREEAAETQSQIQGLYDQIERMDKDALAEFASTKYRQVLNKRTKVESLREQVRGFIDQFGAV